jgi:hypothetical protein
MRRWWWMQKRRATTRRAQRIVPIQAQSRQRGTTFHHWPHRHHRDDRHWPSTARPWTKTMPVSLPQTAGPESSRVVRLP